MNNIIRYTSRTFNTVMSDINSYAELKDKSDWFKKLVAGSVDTLAMMINAAANNAFLRTCFTKQALIDICERMGYRIPPHTTAMGKMLFHFKAHETYPQYIARADLAAVYNGLRFEARTPLTFAVSQIPVTISNNQIAIEARKTGEKVRFADFNPDTDYYLIRLDAAKCAVANSLRNASLGIATPITGDSDTLWIYSAEVDMIQGTYKETALGKVDAVEFPEVYLPDKDILVDTLAVRANDDDYTRVDTLLFSAPTDEHFQFIRKSNGNSAVLFGNGVYGKKPLNAEITVSYFYGGGAKSNVKEINVIQNYAGGAAAIEACGNSTTFTGGSDEKNIETIRTLAPGALRVHDRFVTIADGENLAMSFGGIALAKVIPNAYGILTAQVICVAENGGNPTAQVKANLRNYLTERAVLNSIDVHVDDTKIIPQDIALTARIKASYDADFVQRAIRLGALLFFSETCAEITHVYNSNGIEAAVEKIKNIFGLDTLPALFQTVEKFFDYLNEFGYRTFGETIRESQFITFLTISIQGIEYIEIARPTFPIVFAETAICGLGNILVEISQ